MTTKTEIKSEQELVEKIEATTYEELLDDAKLATDEEHAMTIRQGIKAYPKAIMWSMAVSAGVIMEGFDQIMMGSFWAYPSFQKYYGVPSSKPGKYEIPAKWQTGISNASSCGQFIGLLITGYCTDRLGYRKTMIAALFIMAGFIFIPFFAKNLSVLLVGQLLIGMTWGVFQTITTTYASEVCPVALRGYLTTWVNICWKIGNFLSVGVIRGLLYRTDPWGFRIPFAMQWIWPIPLSLVLIFAPESPWWLVRKGKEQEALKSLERLGSKGSTDPRKTLALIKHAVMLEKELTKGGTYLDCFRGVDLRRTHITCIAYICQSLCGSQLLGYSTYFLEKGGLNSAHAFDFTLGQYSIAIIACVICWFLMKHYGRRTLYLSSYIQMFFILMVIGILGCVKQTSGIGWATGVILLVLMFTYDIGIGPIVYAIVTEIPSSRLRAKTVALGRATYVIGQIIGHALTPNMLNSLVWNWAQKSGFFWGGATFLCAVWIYFFLPETAGLTYAEIDARFANHVPARKFTSTHIDLFGDRDNIVPVKEAEEKAKVETHEEVK